MKIPIKQKTLLKVNMSIQGETIEQKIERIVSNKEPIKDGSPIIYTDRKDGVQPDYDIRTDRWEFAIDGMDKVTKARLAKRAEFYKPKEELKTPNLSNEIQTNVQSTANTSTT